jgi:hypothetical protein
MRPSQGEHQGRARHVVQSGDTVQRGGDTRRRLVRRERPRRRLAAIGLDRGGLSRLEAGLDLGRQLVEGIEQIAELIPAPMGDTEIEIAAPGVFQSQFQPPDGRRHGARRGEAHGQH